MEETFKISFRISPFQEFNSGSIVTYRDENLMEYIKETLYSKTNFFYIENIDWNQYRCRISNGIDSIESTPDQLIEVVSYVEKIKKEIPYNSSIMLENLIKWQENFENQESYLLEDQKMSIMLESSIIQRGHFKLMNKIVKINSFLKNYQVARFDDEMILNII
jgi:hypothetical protein